MCEIKTEEEVHEVLMEVVNFYQKKHSAPALLHLLADIMYLMFGNEKCIDALAVVDNALVNWAMAGCPKQKERRYV